MSVPRSIVTALALVAALTRVVPRDASAQEPSTAQRATAESLFADGKRLMAAGSIALACNAFAESQRLDAGGGTLFALALCHEQARRTASAWLEFKEALAVARRDGRHDREVLALEHIQALEPRVAHLTIRVPQRSPELVVTLDGAPIVDAAWGSAIPIDGGPHSIDAVATGKRRWSTTITIGADGDAQTVDVPLLEDAPSVAAVMPDTTPAVDPHRAQRIAGYVVSGAGIAMIGVGVGFGIRAVITKNRSDASCDQATCDASGLADYESSRSAARVSNIGLGAGVVALAVGVVLIVTGHKSDDAQSPAKTAFVPALVPVIGPSHGGFALSGRF